ncbi:GspH/FimT family pseudopilin [Plasticicumulans acidivorans]|uniref:Type II secretion system protein H n=1 Tax=Plasticicumulans acidivorans TaxID=886464 RepID=A0A317MRH5_9GAMM|nr:GspH/FimT family pseudopilin [Plasticicumulans acidivorans]PWV59316.1 type IV fimbrial biogenesis protein FimT [Plasticicumulans acidivorans]
MSPHAKYHTGMTLIELMVTLAIAIILIVVGIPSFRFTIQQRQIDALVSDLLSDLTLARMEALRRGTKVRVCAQIDALTAGALPSCNDPATPVSYRTGWQVVYAAAATSDQMLSHHEVQATTGITSTSTFASTNGITFNSVGLLSGRTGTIAFCMPDSAGGVLQRTVVVNLQGRVRSTTFAHADSCGG